MNTPIIIIGAGGHARVVADALLLAGERVIGFADSDPEKHGRRIFGVPVLGDDGILARYSAESVLLANGIGGTGTGNVRVVVQQELQSRGWRFASVRHPRAIVSPFATLAAGTQLFAASVVQAGAELGEGCVVNTAGVVEHDVRLGAWTHVAPRALVCGDVMIGRRCHVGAGAVVRQGLSIGDDTVIGAGAVVLRDSAGGGMLIGVPARATGRKA